jgi:hypothetical protein
MDAVDTNVFLWSGLVGVVLPLGISVINQSTWAPRARGLMAFLLCLVAAAGTSYFAGELSDEGDLATAVLTVLVAAIGSYQGLWKPSTIAGSIERATTF